MSWRRYRNAGSMARTTSTCHQPRFRGESEEEEEEEEEAQRRLDSLWGVQKRFKAISL